MRWPWQPKPLSLEQATAEMVVMLFESERDQWERWKSNDGLKEGFIHNFGCVLYQWCGCGWQCNVEDEEIHLTTAQQNRIDHVLKTHEDKNHTENLHRFAEKILARGEE